VKNGSCRSKPAKALTPKRLSDRLLGAGGWGYYDRRRNAGGGCRASRRRQAVQRRYGRKYARWQRSRLLRASKGSRAQQPQDKTQHDKYAKDAHKNLGVAIATLLVPGPAHTILLSLCFSAIIPRPGPTDNQQAAAPTEIRRYTDPLPTKSWHCAESTLQRLPNA
jgi:hypothetical protein